MTPALRKRHRQIWIVLALLLPLLFVAAWRAIPQPVYQEKLPGLPPLHLNSPQKP